VAALVVRRQIAGNMDYLYKKFQNRLKYYFGRIVSFSTTNESAYYHIMYMGLSIHFEIYIDDGFTVCAIYQDKKCLSLFSGTTSLCLTKLISNVLNNEKSAIIDNSHVISVKYAQETGMSELEDQFNK
jgi:hypothetical protein